MRTLQRVAIVISLGAMLGGCGGGPAVADDSMTEAEDGKADGAKGGLVYGFLRIRRAGDSKPRVLVNRFFSIKPRTTGVTITGSSDDSGQYRGFLPTTGWAKITVQLAEPDQPNATASNELYVFSKPTKYDYLATEDAEGFVLNDD